MLPRRIVSWLALVAVAWAALWPLITAAHALASAESMPLCHQAGMQVGVDEPVMDSTGTAPAPTKQHCPLCIIAFVAMGSAPAVVAADRIAPTDLAREYRGHLEPADLSARFPESRAPPPVIPA